MAILADLSSDGGRMAHMAATPQEPILLPWSVLKEVGRAHF